MSPLNWLRRVLGRSTRTAPRPRRFAVPTRPILEALEDRVVPTYVPPVPLEDDDLRISTIAYPGASATNVTGSAKVAVRPDGSEFVAVWSAADGGGGSIDQGVYARVYDGNWKPISAEFRVNTVFAGQQANPTVAMDDSGNFVVAWGGDVPDAAGQTTIYARRFKTTGTATSPVVSAIDTADWQVAPAVNAWYPSAATNATGQVEIAWLQGSSVYSLLAAQFTLTDPTNYGTTPPSAATLKQRTIYTAPGGASTETAQPSPAVAIDRNGTSVVAFAVKHAATANRDAIQLQYFDAAHSFLTPSTGVTSTTTPSLIRVDPNTATHTARGNVSVGLDDNRNAVVAWDTQHLFSPTDTGIHVVFQRLGATGALVGGNTQADTRPNSNTSNASRPSVAVDASTGNFDLVWQDQNLDGVGMGYGIYTKLYTVTGATTTALNPIELPVNSTVEGHQTAPAIAVVGKNSTSGSAGDAVIVFVGNGAPGDGPAGSIYLHRYAQAPTVQFDATPGSGSEASNASVAVTRSGTMNFLANVQSFVSVTNAGAGTADPGEDYTTGFPATVTLAATPGATTQTGTLTIEVVNDLLDEAGETIVLGFGPSPVYVVGTQSAFTYTITDNDPAPSISVSSPTVTEGNDGTTILTFDVGLSAPSGRTVTVNYATADGTARAGDGDYDAESGALTFAPGETSLTVVVTINGDDTSEVNETLFLNLTAATNTSNPTASGTGTILDDDPLPSLTINSPTVTEGDGGTVTLSFAVNLSAASGRTVTVGYATADGTAEAGSDYVAGSGTLTFNPGETTKTIAVTVTGDAALEGAEALTAALSNASAATITTATGTGTILDNDAPASASVSAGNSQSAAVGTSFATDLAVLVKNASGSPVQGASVVFTAPASGASGTFSNGSKAITVTTGADGVATAGAFTANTTLGSSYQVSAAVAGGSAPAATFTLSNIPATNLSINDVTVTEGNAGTKVLTFTVTASPANAFSTTTVDWATADGTASNGDGDYVGASGTLTFAPGATSRTIVITVNGDTKSETNETFAVVLSNAVNGTITRATGTGTITNDDAAPALVIGDAARAEGNSGTTAFAFTVTLTSPAGQPVTVSYSTVNGTASTADGDYVGTSGVLTFAPGVTTQTVTVQVNGDTTYEQDETFTVELSSPSNAIITTGTGTGTITSDDAVPALSVNDVTRAEGDAGSTAYTFTVGLGAPSSQAVTVVYATADGTATTADGDYTSASGTLTFAPGATTRTVTVQVSGDTRNETDEAFTLNLSGATNATIADGAGAGAVTNDDPVPALSVGDVTRAEGDAGSAAFTFTVTLSAASGRAVAVNYATADGTATTADGDYTSAGGTLTFAPGATTQTVTVQVSGDTRNEADESFTLNLSGATNATIATPTGAGTIVNDDSVPGVSINDVSRAEGDSGAAAFVFTVTLSAASGRTVTVNYATADGTAATADGDYASASGTLTFAPGATTRTVTVQVNGDTKNEVNEAFTLSLSSPTNATISASTATGTGTITNDDPVPTLSVNDVTRVEGGDGTTGFTFTVTLSAVSGQAVTVDYATADGTAATADGDYTSAGGTLTFAPGATTRTVTVQVSGDTRNETDEAFALNLSGATNATIADASATGTIANDDPVPALSVGDVTRAEGDAGSAAFTFTVTLSAASGRAVAVNYATADGMAKVPDGDYASASGTLTFAPGATTQTVTVQVSGDTRNEADESFALNLSGATNATIATPTGGGTIVNDDPVPTLSVGGVSVVEGDAGTTAFTFTVTLSAASGRSVTVDYATADGTAATADGDYTSTSGTLTFAPGVTTRTVTVQVSGDTRNETDEAFTLNLSGATNATIADGAGAGAVTNDDPVPALSVGDVTRAEGDAGSTAFTFTVTLSAASGRAVTVDYATADGTATSGDYAGTSGTLTFAPGATTRTVTVQVSGDTRNETDEAFTLNLSGATNATIADGAGAGAVTNDDPVPALSVGDVTRAEGDAGSAAFTFTVTLSAASGRTVTVNYATADGTAATADGDYTSASGTLTFAPGTTTQTVTVQVSGDTRNEADESFTLNLSGATNATLATPTGAGAVTNDDPVPTLSVDDVTRAERDAGSTAFTFTVTLSAVSGQTVTVNYATADGTAATADGDYAGTSGTLTFAPGATTRTVTVQANGDNRYEPNEAFTLNLSGATNAIIVTPAGTGTITTDDVPARVVLVGGGGQQTDIFTTFRSPLTVTVFNANNVPVQGATVTFQAPTAGASGTFGNSAAALAVTTDAGGTASSGAFRANSTPGANYAVTATVAGSSLAPIVFSLTNATSPTLGALATPAWTVGRFYSSTMAIVGGSLPYGNLIVTGLASTGLVASVVGDTVTISGTPTAPGTFLFNVSVRNDDGVTFSRLNNSLVINPAPTLGALPVTQWTVGRAYSASIPVGNGTPGVTLQSLTGLDGTGLSAASDGSMIIISGTPATPGAVNFNVTVVDGVGAVVSRAYTLTVNDVPALGALSATQWTVKRPYNATIPVSEGTTNLTLDPTKLPSTLRATLSGRTITVKGTPAVTGTVNFTVTVRDAAGATVVRSYELTVNAVPTLGRLTVTRWTKGGSGFTGTMAIGRGTTPFTVLAQSGLPTGLSAVVANGAVVFTGTPTRSGVFFGRVTIRDAAGARATRAVTIVIKPPLRFVPAVLPAFTVNRLYSRTIAVGGGTGTRTVAYTLSGPLPAGLTIGPASPTTGAITIKGTPKEAGTVTIGLTVADQFGGFATIAYTLTGQ